MELVELLRVRRSLLWHAGILFVLVLAIIALGPTMTINVNGSGGSTQIASGMTVPLHLIATIAAFFAAIYASAVGTSLNRESATRDLSWTKPLSRTALAVRFVLIDLMGVVAGFVCALAAVVVVLAHANVAISADAQTPGQLILGAGVGGMWYGLLQVLTCGFPPAARAMAGILWPIALVLEGLKQLNGSFGAAVRTIDVANPLFYIGNMGEAANGTVATALQTGPSVEIGALTVWFFTLVFCAAAIAIWPRREA
jgi:hypothetical protein